MILDQYFRGLADATRVRILNLLLHGELCVCDIQFVLEAPQPNVSRHLTYLKNCGLLLDRRAGPRIYYRLAPSAEPWRRPLFRFLETAFRDDRLLAEDTRKLQQAIEAGSCNATAWRPLAGLRRRAAVPRETR